MFKDSISFQLDLSHDKNENRKKSSEELRRILKMVSSKCYEPVLRGVPQVSVLGPLLFLLSFDDVGHVLSHCNIIMYANDTVICTSAKDHSELQQKLSDDFNRVVSWLEMFPLLIYDCIVTEKRLNFLISFLSQ